MSRTSPLLLAGASLAMAFGLAATGMAQAQAASDAPPPPMGGHMMHMHEGERAEHMAKHLRDALQLRPDQDGALKTFLEAMKPMHKPHEAMEKHEALSTPEHLDRALAEAEEHLAMMKAHVAAVKSFYAQLSPSQQKAFDALAPEMMHHHMMQMHEHMGMHGPMGPTEGGEGHMPPPTH